MTKTVDIIAETAEDFDGEKTPVTVRASCWRCLKPCIQIAAPAPGSHHEALRISACVESRDGKWGWCARQWFIRLAGFVLYCGPEHRRVSKPHAEERRKLPPPIPPRTDGDAK